VKHLIPEVDVPWTVPVTGLLFFLFFIGVIFYVFSSRKKNDYKAAEELPLDDGELVATGEGK
jgi:cbb3-type cytochrome oxidase subunit 3